ncbi:hypothetical protein [Isoalcanivorax indicus]|uniref:hypothetical protein n=1 Tax=Isoalcanivorax indicus TaxID=2202653 RepID=UPI000DB9DD93|nr:hypothetical protein [Isoalcanivorax indicus]
MSRMVRESETSGLRERLFLARDSLALLRRLRDEQAPHGRLLALRGAVIFHAYSALVGLVRQAARSYHVAGHESLLSLAALEQAFAAARIEAPEQTLVARARRAPGDPVAWLDQEMMTAFGAAGLSRRPQPRNDDERVLAVAAEDPYALLEHGDMERLEAALDRVAALLADCAPYAEEW